MQYGKINEYLFVRFYQNLHLTKQLSIITVMKKLILILAVLFFVGQAAAQNAVIIKQISKNGDPVIFLPHIGCSSEMWKEITEHYKKTHSVYLVNFAGFDGQAAINAPYTGSYVKTIQQYVKDQGLKNIILVGQNYGAFVAVQTAMDKSIDVKAIIASDFYPKLRMVLSPDMTNEQLETMKAGIQKATTQMDDSSFAASQQQVGEMMNFNKPQDVKRFVEWQLKSDRKTLAGTLCEQLEADLLPLLKKNTIPLLVFTTWYFAKKFKQMPVTEADKKLKEMYAGTPNVTHAVTEDAKDFIAVDQPKWFINEMDKFLKKQTVGR